ncbi:hypothetical protein GCM10029976_019940 [Kribbella albertanoniae]
MKPRTPLGSVEHAAQQIEQAVHRTADEVQLTVPALPQHAGGASDELVQEEQFANLDTVKERAELIRPDQVPAKRPDRLHN